MIHTLAIVGAKFRPPALGLLSVLPAGAALVLRREPSNQYDTNAIQVLVLRSTLAQVDPARLLAAIEGFGTSLSDINGPPAWHLGYVPRTDAETLAPQMDAETSRELPGELTFGLTGAPSVRADFG